MENLTKRSEVERALRVKYEAGDLESGLFKAELGFVVMDNYDGILQFTWFDEAIDLSLATATK